MKTAILLSALVAVASTLLVDAGADDGVGIAVVGCRSDGQVGPVDAPVLAKKDTNLPLAIADRLSFYRGPFDRGVLGPRGWSCIELTGSNGTILFVTPETISTKDLLTARRGIKGSAIQLTERSTETSGRYEVARIVARVFPQHMNFVRDVIAMGVEGADAYPAGPFPADVLRYRDNWTVEFETPANTEGVGTMSRLEQGDLPIRGIIALETDNDAIVGMTMATIRLEPGMANLTPYLIRDVAR